VKEKSFEAQLKKLEEIAGALEEGELDLAETLRKYEQGIKAYRACQKILADAEHKVVMLSKDESGELVEKPFRPEADNSEGQEAAEPDSRV
jgi:exodeoxyribonuclease VII small subunit